jgi:hypothetical protein
MPSLQERGLRCERLAYEILSWHRTAEPLQAVLDQGDLGLEQLDRLSGIEGAAPLEKELHAEPLAMLAQFFQGLPVFQRNIALNDHTQSI